MIDRNRRTGRAPVRSLLALGGLLFGLMSFGAAAQEPEASVCLAKTDRTGGRLAFIVRESDAAMFENAGFTPIACPASFDEAAVTLAARCTRFRSYDAYGQQVISDLYGLSVDQMCAATDAWVRTQSGG
jgi:hypothetical protein